MVKRLLEGVWILPLLLLSACSSVSGPFAGELEVRITGLPDGVQARVVAIGPEGKSLSFPASGVKPAPAGDWAVEAKEVEVEGKRYIPSVSPAQVKVEYGKRARVEVRYAVDPNTLPGKIIIEVSGLPDGRGYLRKPDGTTVSWTGPTVFSGLPSGPYQVGAYSVGEYEPQVDPPSLTLSPGEERVVRVVYERRVSRGNLLVRVEGLPDPDGAELLVEGPGGYERRLNGPALLEGLAPGTYVVSARRVVVGGGVYEPLVSSKSVEVQAGATAEVVMSYRLVQETGSLAIQVHGLPGPDLANIKVDGPSGYRQSLRDSALLEGLTPGTYVVSAYPIVADGQIYRPTVQGSPAQVEAGRTATVIITYEPENSSSPAPYNGP